MLQKSLVASVLVVLLVSGPMAMAAQEKDARSSGQASVVAWLAGLWSDLAAWLGYGSSAEGSCSLDPNGCPGGAAAPAEPLPGAARDSSCSVDPDGCPGGQ